MVNLPDSNDQVASLFVLESVTFTREPHLHAWLHSRLDFDLSHLVGSNLAFASRLGFLAVEIELLGTSVEEFVECAAQFSVKILGHDLVSIENCILVQVTLDLLKELYLLAFVIKGDHVWVSSPKEVFKHLCWVSIERVA